MKNKVIAFMMVACAAGVSQGAETTIDIRADRPGATVQPTMYGLFFEDINFAADGGLYAEMVKNRSFEFPQSMMGWRTFGNVELLDSGGPFERNPHYVRLTPTTHAEKHTGIDNEGFFGMSLRGGADYRFSVWARTVGEAPARLRVELIDQSSRSRTQVLAATQVEVGTRDWRKYEAVLSAPEGDVRGARLRIFLEGKEAVDLEHVSLFPADTWGGQASMLRKDLVQKLADMRPGLLRFPGGCIVEGTDLATRYQWKNTVGPAENRPLNENRWHYTFPSRFYPDYYQTYGLGFYEYFLLSEDIGAEPLPVLNVGLSCQYQNHDESAHVPLDSLQPYIDDVLDLIEFANGDTTTTWGALRASMGHPKPFGLKYVAIGNEQWDAPYTSRLAPFVEAVRARYPEIKIVGSSGPDPEGDKFEYLWPEMGRIGADLVDEHYYRNEDWFLRNATRYDGYDRRGPAVFAGEYACHGADGRNYNHFNAALMEAALMTGLERNADIVHMATYAPLFAHVDGWQWRPDMIWFDGLESVATSSYYVQQMFARNRGAKVLRTTVAGGADPVAGQDGLYASAVTDGYGGYIVKIVNTADATRPVRLAFRGLKKKRSLGGVSAVALHAADIYADNTLENPSRVVPVEVGNAGTVVAPHEVSIEIPARTFAVYYIK
ncbi:MAG: carbohydrate binding domain-containing protein [Muribaculaceae bacterium]|nr:carbohydrate binding domain-containing protein [Muribaculaceae bacterium]